MKFLQKRWVSVVLCIVMIISAISITNSRNKQREYSPDDQNAAEAWAEEYYGSYTRFVDDRANALSENTIQELSIQNAALDYSHSSICGVAVVNTVGGKSMEDAAYDMSAELQLGDSDALLLIDIKAEDWYFAYGADFSYYVDHELELLFRSAMDGAYQDLDASLPALYSDLADWYGTNMPLSENDKISTGSSSGSALFVTLLVILLIVGFIMSSITRFGRRVIGGYRPRRFWYAPGVRIDPISGMPRHTTTTSYRRPGQSGGFGGSRRGGGFSGRSGGFGGSSRGGGFGGKR